MAKKTATPKNVTIFRSGKVRAQYVLDLPGLPAGASPERYRKASGCPSNKYRGGPVCPIQLVYPYPDRGPYLRLCEKIGARGALVRVRSIPQAYEQALELCRAAGYILPKSRKGLVDVANEAGAVLEQDAEGKLVLGRVRPRRKR